MKPHEIRNMTKSIIGKNSQPDEVEKDESDQGDFESMHIEKADNGYTVTTRRKAKPAKGNEPQPYDEGKRSVFTHADHVADHVRKSIH